MKKRRTLTYVDGFNLYHAINDLDRENLKWVNLWSLSESLLRGDEMLVGVKYFSAYATWLPEQMNRHRAYTKALQHVGVDVILGQFKKKRSWCSLCQRRYETREEKETDLNLGLSLVTDGMLNMYDRAILITADTDLRAALKTAQQLCPEKEIFVAAPPGRMQRGRGLKPKY